MSVTGSDIKRIKEITGEFISRLGADLDVEVSGDTDGIKIKLSGKDAALVIGYHGETLADLAYLVGLVIKKRLDKEERVRVDIEGYLENKDRKIKEMVLKVIDKVRKSGFPEEVTGLNSYERRVAHTVVSKEGLVSESIGFGKERKLIIKPRRSVEED